jgi:hypothetical protein
MSDPTLTGFENWPSHHEPAKGGSRGGGFVSTILPIVFGLVVGVGIGAWYLAKPAGSAKKTQWPKPAQQQQSWVSWSFGGQSGKSGKLGKKGMSWQDQLKKQGEDDLRRIQEDIEDRIRNSGRPGW